MKIIAIIFVTLLSACVNQRKAEQWMDAHETKAAAYCSTRFPVDTVQKTVFKNVDSSGYLDAYLRVSDYADTLLWKLDYATHAATPDKPYKPNIDSLRSAIDKEIRRRLKPCIDSVVYVQSTVIDHAREAVMQGELYEKDNLINTKDHLITDLQSDLKGARKWQWYFIGLIALIAGYIFLKIRFKLPF